ncbi:MAG: GNAT family N-acetyltransferase, partial [Thermomicrobiaceae bacterium]|nr:GNAT family N-acetyltransferase [Thermomicrobiaceae bacterium]
MAERRGPSHGAAGAGEARPDLAILGERVALGPLRRDLVPTYQRWFNDFGTFRTLGAPPRPLTLDEQTAQYAALASGGASHASFTIYERATGRPIGTTALVDIDHRDGSAELVLIIGEVEARGRGYGTETTRLVLDYAFAALGLRRVALKVYAYNLAGIRAYQKAGFREVGRRRQGHWMGGRLWDVIEMECRAEDRA